MKDNKKTNNLHSNRFNFFIILFISIIILFLVVTGFAKSKRKNVLDYYLLLPDEYFFCEFTPKITKEHKRQQIIRKNIKNGFILSKSEGFDMEVALFRYKRGGRSIDIIAVNIRCGAGCMCNRFEFLAMRNDGSWKKVTANIFPSEQQIVKKLKTKNEVILEYYLPEFGTTVKVFNSITKKLLIKLYWRDSRFVFK